MGRHADTLLRNSPVADAQRAPQVNLGIGGQNGHSMDVGMYVPNAAYVSKPVICFMLTAPTAFQLMANGDSIVKSLKALFEVHAETIEGLNSSITIEHAETNVGGANEVQQDVTKVNRERSTVTINVPEKYGEAVKNLILHGWVFPLLGDPDTNYPRITYDPNVELEDLLPDRVSATLLFVEPDPTGRKVQKAWLHTNVQPTGTIEETGARDKRAGGETKMIAIELTNIQQVGEGVNELAQKMLDDASLAGANPHYRNAFVQGRSADVQAASNGYMEQINAEKGDMVER